MKKEFLFTQFLLATNSVVFENSPSWMNKVLALKSIEKIERKLEWSTRQVKAIFYSDQAELVKAFGKIAPDIFAFTRKQDQSIHLGPKLNKDNFSQVFGHELAHAIIQQKYENKIPSWLEEGIANASAGVKATDYKWLKNQKLEALRTLGHPFSNPLSVNVNLSYMESTAAAEMLDKKCHGLREILNLAMKEDFESLLKTFCKIEDLDLSFSKWVLERGKK